jgi:cytochrome c oxidase cbb3-type subunit 1
VFVMAADLTLAGLFQGYFWASLQPWDVSVDGSMPFWILRVVAGLAMLAGLVCFLANLHLTWRARGVAPAPTAAPLVAVVHES